MSSPALGPRDSQSSFRSQGKINSQNFPIKWEMPTVNYCIIEQRHCLYHLILPLWALIPSRATCSTLTASCVVSLAFVPRFCSRSPFKPLHHTLPSTKLVTVLLTPSISAVLWLWHRSFSCLQSRMQGCLLPGVCNLIFHNLCFIHITHFHPICNTWSRLRI